MDEYLNKNFIEKILKAHLEDSRGAENYAYNIIKRELMSAPGADVTLVKHGHWKLHNVEGEFFGKPTLVTWACNCSVCGRDGGEETPYCPWCGAEMEVNRNE